MQQSPTDLHTLTHQYIEIGCVFAEKKTTSAYCLAFYSEVYDPPAEKKKKQFEHRTLMPAKQGSYFKIADTAFRNNLCHVNQMNEL